MPKFVQGHIEKQHGGISERVRVEESKSPVTWFRVTVWTRLRVTSGEVCKPDDNWRNLFNSSLYSRRLTCQWKNIVCVYMSENCWWLYLNFSMMWDLKWSLAGVEFCECRCVGMCESWRHLISRWTSCAGLRRGQTDGWHRCQSMVTWQHKGWTEGYSVKPSLPWVCVGSLELTHAFILTFCPSTLSSKRFISGLEASSDLVWSWWDLRITWTCLAWWTTLWSSRQYATPFRIRLWIWHFQKCTRLWLIVSWISRKHLSSFLKFWMHFE